MTVEPVSTASIYQGDLTSEDTRFSKWAQAQPVNIQLAASPLVSTSTDHTLTDYDLYYQNNKGDKTLITVANSTVDPSTTYKWGYQNISTEDKWVDKNRSTNNVSQGAGLNFTVPANQAQPTGYSATLTWTFANNTPAANSVIQ